MIGTRETLRVRLEIEFEVLAGELQVMEENLRRMILSQFVQVWDPERRSSGLVLKVIDIDKEKDGKRKKTKKEIS